MNFGLVLQIVDVPILHPDGHRVPVQLVRGDHGKDADALTPRGVPFLAHDLGDHGAGGHHHDDELYLVEHVVDLAPPPLAPTHTFPVAPDGDIRLLDTPHQVGGEGLSVLAGVGDEDTGRLGHESKGVPRGMLTETM